MSKHNKSDRAFFERHKYIRRAVVLSGWMIVIPIAYVLDIAIGCVKACWTIIGEESVNLRDLYADLYRDGWIRKDLGE